MKAVRSIVFAGTLAAVGGCDAERILAVSKAPDGGGNPGEAGFGVYVQSKDGGVDELYGYLGHATNNVAEYEALLHALREPAASCAGSSAPDV